MTRMVLARIKRFGSQFATCGVGIQPPANDRGRKGLKYLCPKLRPGQVVEVPHDHNLLNQPCVEIVRRVEADEILRPIVFANAEEAILADPNSARMPAEKIREMLDLRAGAADNRRRELEARQASAARVHDATYEDAPVTEEDEPTLEQRASNRVLRQVKDEAQPRSLADDMAAAAREDATPRRRRPGR